MMAVTSSVKREADDDSYQWCKEKKLMMAVTSSIAVDALVYHAVTQVQS